MKIKWLHVFKTLFIPRFEKEFIEYLRTLSEEKLKQIEIEYEDTFLFLIKISTLKKRLFSRDFRKLEKSVKQFNTHLSEVSKKLPEAAQEKAQNENGKKEDHPIYW